jgi:hypothetical protein
MLKAAGLTWTEILNQQSESDWVVPQASQRSQEIDRYMSTTLWKMFTHKDKRRAEWIYANAATFDFALSLMHGVTRWGGLTPKQAHAVDRCIQRSHSYANNY